MQESWQLDGGLFPNPKMHSLPIGPSRAVHKFCGIGWEDNEVPAAPVSERAGADTGTMYLPCRGCPWVTRPGQREDVQEPPRKRAASSEREKSPVLRVSDSLVSHSNLGYRAYSYRLLS